MFDAQPSCWRNQGVTRVWSSGRHGQTPGSRGGQRHGRPTLRRPARRGRHGADLRDHGDRRGTPPGVRPCRALELVQRRRPRRTCVWSADELLTGDRVDYRFGRLVEEIDHVSAQGDPRRRVAGRLRRTRHRHRLVPVRAPGARPRSRRVLRVPHARRPRPDPPLGHHAGTHHRPRDRRWTPRPRSGQRTQGARPRRPRRGDGALPDAAAARRGRRPDARRAGSKRSASICTAESHPISSWPMHPAR